MNNLMTIDLEKELLSVNRKLTTPKELLEIREFEKNDGMIENDALDRVGITSAIKRGQNHKKRIEALRAETAPFKQERVFHISQIESVCRKYDLRFLNSSLYAGSIDPSLATKITHFEAAYGVECFAEDRDDISVSGIWESIARGMRRSFELSARNILYPFTESEVGREVLEPKATVTTTKKKLKTLIAAPKESFQLEQRPKDPLFFAQINSEYFYLIHKWGNDLSVFRRLVGWWRNEFRESRMNPFSERWRSEFRD